MSVSINCSHCTSKGFNRDTSMTRDIWVGTTGCCWCHSDQPTVRSVFNLGFSLLLATPLVPQYTHHRQLNSKYPNTKKKKKKHKKKKKKNHLPPQKKTKYFYFILFFFLFFNCFLFFLKFWFSSTI